MMILESSVRTCEARAEKCSIVNFFPQLFLEFRVARSSVPVSEPDPGQHRAACGEDAPHPPPSPYNRRRCSLPNPCGGRRHLPRPGPALKQEAPFAGSIEDANGD